MLLLSRESLLWVHRRWDKANGKILFVINVLLCFRSKMETRISSIQKLAILCGTHGNELSSVFLWRFWLTPEGAVTLDRDSLSVSTILTNELAVERCRRYIDVDLNRNFGKNLERPVDNVTPYETKRVIELEREFGGKNQFLVDLHNTTSNVGVMLLVNHHFIDESPSLDEWVTKNERHWLSLHAALYVQSRFRRMDPPVPCEIFVTSARLAKSTLASTLSTNFGMVIEVGPQPQGVYRADVVRRQKLAVQFVLDFLQSLNEVRISEKKMAEVFVATGTVDFPRDGNSPHEVAAVIHPDLQDKDYTFLEVGRPIFLKPNEEEIVWDGTRGTYPLFINEAAYYEKGIAFFCSDKRTLEIPSLKLL